MSTNVPESTNTYSYTDTNWKDKLTAYNGVTITYDNIGNPLSYYNGSSYTFTWKDGRRLATLNKGTTSVSYKYNSDGIRYEKNVNGVVHKYYLMGSTIIPYWRVVGKGGRITMGSRYAMSREAKIRHLSDEGISTEAFGNDLVRVVNYKDFLFDLSVIDHSVIISNPGTENTTDSVIRTFLMDSDKIKGVPDEMLMMISEERCNANDTADRIKMLENIKRELERRKNMRK